MLRNNIQTAPASDLWRSNRRRRVGNMNNVVVDNYNFFVPLDSAGIDLIETVLWP